MALVGEMNYLTIGGSTYSIPISGGSTVTVTRDLTSGTKSATISIDGTNYDLYAPTPNAGTVTSVRVQATSPVQSSTSTAQSSTLNTTISLANGYGDTKNPYGTKTANYILAGPTSGSAAEPTFRKLVATDIPDLSSTYLTNSTLYEANLQWGGKDFSASYSPIDAAMIDTLGANRFAFLKAAGLTIEYSTDGGSSWSDYGATDAQKVTLFSNGNYNFYLGKHNTAGSCTTSDQLRVTIDTGAAGIYTVLNKIVIYMTSYGATTQVLTEKALQNTPTTFITHKDWTGITGWSGWNVLNISNLTTYGNNATVQYGRVRFTFRQTAVNTSYSSAAILRIMGFGGVGWTVPSNMARDGHLYTYDSSQNATFPAKITASGGFSGNLTGNVTGTATGNLTSVQYDSTNAKLTYTKNGSNTDIVTVATLKSALGSMPASDVYSWAKASTKPTYTASEVGAVATSAVGAASGVVPLNSSSKIDSTYLPSYVDDVLEYNGISNFPSTGETGKIYVDTSTNKTYRWGGSSYTEISQGSIVTVSRSLTSGTKSATITVDGTSYDIYSVTNTNTDTLVTQTATTTNSAYELLFSATADNTTRTETARKTSTLTYNPSSKALQTGGAINGYTLAAASAKAVDTSISAASTSANLPTSAAVASFVEGKGYITSADVPEGASAYTGTISAVGTSASTGTSNGFARGDHVHNITSSTITSALGYTPYDSTNPSGYITSYTDEKMKWTASTSSNTYYPLQSTSTATTSTANTLNSVSFYQYYNTAGGYRRLILGNATAYTSSGGAYGTIRLYGTGATYYGDLNPGTIGANSLTANRTWTLPDKTGTIALTNDIPTVSYPVTSVNSKTGAVSLTASDVGALASTTTYVSTVTTTAGAHSVITNKSGAVSFNVPTKTSDLTNDSNFITGITKSDVTTALGTGSGTTKFLREDGSWATPAYTTNTDTKVSTAAVTSGTTYYPVVGADTTSAATKFYDKTGIVYTGTNGTANGTNGNALLTLGNSTASTTANWKKGTVRLYGTTAYYTDLVSGAPSANRTITFPNATGTVALTTDVLSYSAGTGLSLSGTTFNHSNSVTAQTTQAIYPIKIDAQGHISAYGTAVTPLTSHQTIKQDGVTGATGNHFGTCSTTAGTAAKTVSITAGTPALEAGLRVIVKFSNANTASTPTLNVNSLGAKNIYHNGAQITSGSNKALLAGTVEFVYDGTQWQLVGNYIDTDINTDTKVTQTYSATNNSYPILMAGTAGITSTSSRGEDISILTNTIYGNPATGNLQATTFNGYTLAAASAKAVVTSIDTSASLPTSNAVKTFVEGKGYITASHTSTYSLPVAANGTRGGVQIGYSESGTNYAVKLSSEKMYVSVPWTDTKVSVTALASGTTYYPVLAIGSGTNPCQIDSVFQGLRYISTAGTTTTNGTAMLSLGNSTANGAVNNEYGVIRLYGTSQYYNMINPGTTTANRTFSLPDKSGTVALTTDIPTQTSQLENDSGFITDTKIFWATYGTTTSAEIEAAYQAGKIVLVKSADAAVYMLTHRQSATWHIFTRVNSILNIALITVTINNNTWSDNVINLALADDYVPKAGGTFTGNLTINGQLYTSSDIHASGSMYLANSKWIRAYNAAGDNARILCGIGSDDNYFFGYGSRDGSVAATYLDGNAVYIRSNGNLNVTATNSIFSGALTLGGHSSAIGTIKDAYLTTAKSVPTGTSTGTPLCSVSLEVGTWLIEAGFRAPANSTGVRVGNVASTSGSSAYDIAAPAPGSYTAQIRWSLIVAPTSTTTYYLNVMQNSGSALSYPASGTGWGNFLRAVRLT